MASARMRENFKTLKVLKGEPAKRRLSFLKRAPDSFVLFLAEIALNVLRGNIPVSVKQFKYLAKHKRALRKLAKKGATIASRRGVLVRSQKGGQLLSSLLGLGIAPLLKLAISGVKKLIRRRKQRKR